jgi:hypothetical protein
MIFIFRTGAFKGQFVMFLSFLDIFTCNFLTCFCDDPPIQVLALGIRE